MRAQPKLPRLPITFRTGDTTGKGLILRVSADGLSVATSGSPPRGAITRAVFLDPQGNKIEVRGSIQTLRSAPSRTWYEFFLRLGPGNDDFLSFYENWLTAPAEAAPVEQRNTRERPANGEAVVATHSGTQSRTLPVPSRDDGTRAAGSNNSPTDVGSEAQRRIAAGVAFEEGRQQLQARDWAMALASFERAVELSPEDGENRAFCAWSLYLAHGREQLPDAIAKARDAVRRSPEREIPYLLLGRLLQLADHLEQAEKMFARALGINPDSLEAARELRIARMRRVKRKGARGLGWLRRWTSKSYGG